MKPLFQTFLSLFVMLISLTIQGQDKTSDKLWSYSLGLGAFVAPSYFGDYNYQIMMAPNFRVTHSDKLQASIYEGISYNIVKTKKWSIGPVIKYDFGRNENGSNPLRIAGNKTKELIGLGDINFTLEPGAFIEHNSGSIKTKFEIRQGIGGHGGLISELKSDYKGVFSLFGQYMIFKVGPEITFGDSNYNNAFFGIDDNQSLETGFRPYKPKHGTLTYGVSGRVILPLTNKISIILFANYKRLGDAAADSQLVKTHGSVNQTTFGLLLNYTF